MPGRNADAQRRARVEAHARDGREGREEADRAARQRRQRAQQQTQDAPWRSKFADLPQSHEQLERHQQASRMRERQGRAQAQRARQAQDNRQVQRSRDARSPHGQQHEEASRARRLAEERRRQGSQMRQPSRGVETLQPAARQRAQQQAARQTAAQQGAVRQQQAVRRQHAAPQRQSASRQQVAGRQQTSQRRHPPESASSRYARDAYVSGTQRRVGARTKYDRRPAIERPSSARGEKKRVSLPHIPKQALAAIVAIFVIVVGIAIINPFGSPDGASPTSPTGMAAKAKPSLPTPIMSESSGVTMHSAVAMEDLTEILIHNASYSYANEITTQLVEATNTEVLDAHGTGRVASEQPTGDAWMTGEFIRCFRSGNAGPTMSAIDCGGPVGATVYAPVTGTVVLVKEYLLYDEIDDYQIHIQPEGRPDLDVVLIHLTDVSVQVGDKVTAGATPIAKIRDIFQYLDESLQLKNYTAVDDNGNHTHIQVNDATHPEYHGLDDLKPAEPAAAETSTAGPETTPGA